MYRATLSTVCFKTAISSGIHTNSPIKHSGPFVEIMGDILRLLHGENRKLLGSCPSLAREYITKLPD